MHLKKILKRLVRSLTPSRATYTTEKIKTSKFTAIRRKRHTPSFTKVLRNISFFIAALCIFEAAVWFSSNLAPSSFSAPQTHWLNSRISQHQPHSVLSPLDVTAQILQSSTLCFFLVLLSTFKLNSAHNKHAQPSLALDSTLSQSLSPSPDLQTSPSDPVVLCFLSRLASPKKRRKWT